MASKSNLQAVLHPIVSSEVPSKMERLEVSHQTGYDHDRERLTRLGKKQVLRVKFS